MLGFVILESLFGVKNVTISNHQVKYISAVEFTMYISRTYYSTRYDRTYKGTIMIP